MKLLHTSSWRIGMGFPHLFARAEPLRQARLGAVKNLLALAVRERCDAVIAVGRIFEDNRIDDRHVQDLARIVSSSPLPVVLVPGSTDPLRSDSPYLRHPEWFTGRCTVAATEDAIRLEGGLTVHARPGQARIAQYTATERESPEPTDFGDSHSVVVVDILSNELRSFAVNTYDWRDDLSFTVQDEPDLQPVEATLEALERPQNTLLRLHLAGSVADSALPRIESLPSRYADRFFYFELDNQVVPLEPATGHPLVKAMRSQIAAHPEAARTLSRLARESGL